MCLVVSALRRRARRSKGRHQPRPAGIAAVAEEETAIPAIREVLPDAALRQDVGVVDAPGPLGDHVQDPGARVNHQLHVDRVVEVTIDVHLLVQRWPLDPNMGAVDGPYDTRKAVHDVVLPLQVGELRRCWPPTQPIDTSCANVRYSSEGRRATEFALGVDVKIARGCQS